jgi:hypothetical protein
MIKRFILRGDCMPRPFDEIKKSQGRRGGKKNAPTKVKIKNAPTKVKIKNVPTKVKIKRILELLLTSIPLTRKEITKKLGFKKSYSDYDPITKPMTILKDGNIIISKGKKRELRERSDDVKILGRGSLSKLWEINRDLQVLRKIYADYPDLRENISKTGWVYDVIVEQGLNPDEIDNIQKKDIRDLYKMLKLSPLFYHLCLTSPSIKQTAIQWSYILHNWGHTPSKKAAKNYIEGIKLRSYPFTAYYDLFVFCNFSDENSGKSSDQSYTFLEKYLHLRRERERNLTNMTIVEKMQFAMIETLKHVVECSAENSGILDQIKEQISCYEHEETEYNKRETAMLLGKEELSYDEVDVIVQRKERIAREIIDLLELGDIF